MCAKRIRRVKGDFAVRAVGISLRQHCAMAATVEPERTCWDRTLDRQSAADEAAGLTPGNEENEARHCFRLQKPYLPLPIDGIVAAVILPAAIIFVAYLIYIIVMT